MISAVVETQAEGRSLPLPTFPRVEIESESCIGCGSCTALATNTFIVNDDLIVELTGEFDAVEDLMAAADACPVFAIALFDADGSQLYPLN